MDLKENKTGRWWFVKSGGGLASALRSIKNIRLIHIGWPGCEVARKIKAILGRSCARKTAYRFSNKGNSE
eukprot:TRINITY_DN5811_c0_g1_i1.p1 TRINITY_DN5811_c0_g1~~TRINITY_DN5811_c0_g1_i1.p1  ORF type:complete len:70 (-),score=2.79 TRINITY_DN5811_c0_g1_i1:127-336(-)